jgi:hypothetical protein
MSNSRTATIAAILFLAAVALPAMSQTGEEIHFTISAPFKLKKSNAELPAGTYLLRQIGDTEHELYGLYSDRRRPPLAVIHTIPLNTYAVGRGSDKTKIILDESALANGGDPVLTGWSLPGGEAWEVTGSKTSEKQIEAQTVKHPTEHLGSQ